MARGSADNPPRAALPIAIMFAPFAAGSQFVQDVVERPRDFIERHADGERYEHGENGAADSKQSKLPFAHSPVLGDPTKPLSHRPLDGSASRFKGDNLREFR